MRAICEVPGAPGYGVDAEGNVYTQWYRGPVNGQRGWRTLRGTEWLPKTAFLHPNGYRCVWLRWHKSQRAVTRLVHRLVLETFAGPCPPDMECRHLDGNRSNNALSNLRWGTKLENEADKDRHGKRPRGRRKAKLQQGV